MDEQNPGVIFLPDAEFNLLLEWLDRPARPLDPDSPLVRLLRRKEDEQTMTHRKDGAEEYAIALLQQIIDIDRRDRDALPGSVVKLCKRAQTTMKKRRKDLGKRG